MLVWSIWGSLIALPGDLYARSSYQCLLVSIERKGDLREGWKGSTKVGRLVESEELPSLFVVRLKPLAASFLGFASACTKVEDVYCKKKDRLGLEAFFLYAFQPILCASLFLLPLFSDRTKKCVLAAITGRDTIRSIDTSSHLFSICLSFTFSVSVKSDYDVLERLAAGWHWFLLLLSHPLFTLLNA